MDNDETEKQNVIKKRKCIEKLRPIDDIMFEAIAKEEGVCEEILRVILEDSELKVKRVVPQKSISNLYGREVRLDALCELSTGQMVNVEVQRSDNDDHLMRARYNTSCITANTSSPGSKFEDIPAVYFVYISEFDVFKKGKIIYHIDNVIRETNTVVDDKCYRIFFNTKIKDGTELSELMECFTKKDFEDPKFPKLSKAFHKYKYTEGGINHMCTVMEEYTNDIIKENEENSVRNLFLSCKRLSYKDVKNSFQHLSEDEIKKIYEEIHQK